MIRFFADRRVGKGAKRRAHHRVLQVGTARSLSSRRPNGSGLWPARWQAPAGPGGSMRATRLSSECQPDPEHFHGIEGKFRIKAALDVVGLTEAMLLAREQEVADRISIAPQRLDHDLGLVRRHHGVLGALEKDHRLR